MFQHLIQKYFLISLSQLVKVLRKSLVVSLISLGSSQVNI